MLALPYVTEHTDFKGKVSLRSLQFYLDGKIAFK
jgi:hypothetical protein